MNKTKSEKSSRTQARIIEAARIVFARDGFADAALNEIIAKAKVTTGAVYYHFTDKQGLFLAVAESLEMEILEEAAKRVSVAGDPWDIFESSVLETLDICARPDILRIVFREAPVVIGLREWREIELKYAFGLMHSTIKELAIAGLIKSEVPDMTAQILLGALMEAAHTVANTQNKSTALKAAKDTLRAMLRALKS